LSLVEDKSIGANDPLVFDTPTAYDASGTAVVQLDNLATNTLGHGSYAVTCTWSATDGCGNQSLTESQTITVAAPIITEQPVQQLTISVINANENSAESATTIPAVSLNSILLRWPTNAVDYRLESADRMNATRWSPVPVTPISTNGEFQVVVPITGPRQFFRLSDGPPVLAMSVSGSKVHLAWPMAPSGFMLEASDNALPGSWTPTPIRPVASNALNHVDLPFQSHLGQKFFRLRK